MGYKVVTGFSAKEIEDKVSELRGEGWMPLGGVSLSIAIDAEGIFHEAFAQALYRLNFEEMPIIYEGRKPAEEGEQIKNPYSGRIEGITANDFSN